MDSSPSRRRDTSAVRQPASGDSFAVGILLLLLVVLLWTSSNFLTNYQLTQGYDKPFAVTYLNTSSFTAYMIPFASVLSLRRRRRKELNSVVGAGHDNIWSKLGFYMPSGSLWSSRSSSATSQSLYTSLPSSDPDRDVHAASRLLRLSPNRPSSIDGRRPRDAAPLVTAAGAAAATANNTTAMEPPLDLHETATLALQFMFVWFLANYCLNVSLKLTGVASATTLSSASGFFTLALGAVMGVEAFSLAKLSAVLMSFLGVLMVTRADSMVGGAEVNEPNSNPYLGDLLALASAFFYAVYVVLLKKRIGDESRVSMPLFFGFVGVLNVTLMWPIGLILHYTGAERLQVPTGRVMWAGVVVNMCITFVSDFAYLLAMLKSSPLVATIGLSLTIPLAIVGDLFRKAHTGGWQSYLGSFIVLMSFVAIGLADRAIARQTLRAESENEERPSRQRARQT